MRCSTLLFKIPQKCSIGFKSGDTLGQVIVFTFFIKRLRDFGSVLWIIIMLEYSSSAKLLEIGTHLVGQAFMVPSVNVISPTPFALMLPHIITLTPP